jgi:hypothetical protein
VIILHTRFQFRNGFHHKIRNIFMQKFEIHCEYFFPFFEFKILYDHRYPDDRFVWTGVHVCITQPTCLQDLDYEFIWLGLHVCMIRDDKILWPGIQDFMTCEAATTGFYDLDTIFLWPRHRNLQFEYKCWA